MKNLKLFGLAILLSSIGCIHNLLAVSFTVNNNNYRSSGHIADFGTALTMANAGDTIYVVPSQTDYGSHTINKQLVIYGNGFNPASHNKLTSRFTQITLGDNTDNTVLSGLYITNNIVINVTLASSLTSILIDNCYVGNRIDLQDPIQLLSSSIEGCILGNDIGTSNTATIDLNTAPHSTTSIRGNVIFGNTSNPNTGAIVGNTLIIENNMFLGGIADVNHLAFGNLSNSTVDNNIFLGMSPSSNATNGNFLGNTFSKNFAHNTYYNFDSTAVIPGPAAMTVNTVGSTPNQNVDPLFNSLTPTDIWSTDLDFSLQAISPARSGPPPFSGVFTGTIEYFTPTGSPLSYIAADTIDVVTFKNEPISLGLRIISTEGGDIEDLEYFFDGNDPGIGLANNLVIGDVDTTDFSTSIATSGLQPGIHTLHTRVVDEFRIWSLPEIFTFFVSTKNSIPNEIIRVEYYFDNDPGYSLATSYPVIDNDTISINDLIPTNALSNGFHSLHFRSQLDNNEWGIPESKIIFISKSGIVNTIDSLEYYIDSDPGFGMGTQIDLSLVADSSKFDIMEMVPTQVLPTGFHNLHVRARLVGGEWGLPESRLFYVNQSRLIEKIDFLEYYVDNDPGYGAGVPIDISAVTDSLDFNLVEMIPTSGLSVGFHNVFLRARLIGGAWGVPESRLIYADDSGVIGKIQAMEYFFDSDPGYGNGMSLDLSGVVDSSAFDINQMVATSLLNTGFHRLMVRAQQVGGNWGVAESTTIYVDPSGVVNTEISQIEVFFDNDPGYGNGHIISLPLASNMISQDTFLLPGVVPQDTGAHVIFARPGTIDGVWGIADTANFQMNLFVDLIAPEVTLEAVRTKDSNSPELRGTIDDSTATIDVTIDGQSYTATNLGDGNWSLAQGTIATLVDGSYNVQIVATDTASNMFDSVFVDSVVIDINAPILTLELVRTKDSSSPELRGTTDDSTSTIDVTIDGQTYSASNPGGGNWSLPQGTIATLADGSYSVQIVSVDSLNNIFDQTFAAAVVVDVTTPVATIESVRTKDTNSPELRGTVDDVSATINVTVDGQTYPASNLGDGNWSLAQGTIAALADGSYDVRVVVTDSLNNIFDQVVVDSVVVDITAPVVTISDVGVIIGNSPGFSGMVNDITATLSVELGAEKYTPTISNDGTWIVASAGTTVQNSLGTFEYIVVATDSLNNIDTVRANLIVSVAGNLMLDSIALVKIYQATDGANWTTNTNWIVPGTDVSTWHGVTVTDNRVTSLSLGSNNLTGSFPELFVSDLNLLQSIDLSKNSLESIPDLTVLEVLSSLNVEENALEFDDLLPNVSISSFSYKDQNSVGSGGQQEVLIGNSIDLTAVASGTVDAYQWLKDDTAITGETSSTYSFTMAANSAGVYTCQLKNSLLPDLTLLFDAGEIIPVVNLSGEIVSQGDQGKISNASVFLLATTSTKGSGYDTIQSVTSSADGSYLFENVRLGAYLLATLADTAVYMGTYFGDVIFYLDAGTVSADNNKSGLNIIAQKKPVEQLTGDNTISGFLEEEVPDDSPNARIFARRRVRLAGVSLYRSKSRSRNNGLGPDWELVAYTQTDENGDFSFTNLPDAVYRIQIEFPGVPLDDNATVEFNLKNEAREKENIELKAVIDEGVISVEKTNVTAIIIDYFKNLTLYPVPTEGTLYIAYEKLLNKDVSALLIDANGNLISSHFIRKGSNRQYQIDMSSLNPGLYIVRFMDEGKTIRSFKIPKL